MMIYLQIDYEFFILILFINFMANRWYVFAGKRFTGDVECVLV